ncbi:MULTISPECIES: hypothetical protein [unclassified Pyramidobacter]|nr:hypothetical protein [Pyramidobacter sp. CG50-2]OON89434.1 hypothetical protein B0D78_03545 [Pyramidobacter sp. C12-8]
MKKQTAGRGWYQEEGKDPAELTPGQVVVIPPNVKHRHGAGRLVLARFRGSPRRGDSHRMARTGRVGTVPLAVIFSQSAFGQAAFFNPPRLLDFIMVK